MTALEPDAGSLAHRVTVESAAGTPDGGGGESVVWDTLATLWARIEPAAGDERIVAGHLSGVVTHHVTFRFREDFAGGMRIAYRGRHFLMLVVSDPDESRRFVVAKCEEETP